MKALPVQTIIPLADSRVRGPLGVSQLPRLWLIELLAASDRLPAYVSRGYSGQNRTVIDGIGLEPDATLAFLATRPSYIAFERWIHGNARALDAPSRAATNATIETETLDAGAAERMRADVGLDDATECGSALLRALADWTAIHAQLATHDGAGTTGIVPAISSQSSGPLGLGHLPRLWLKASLEAAGRLYEGWKSGTPSGFDTWFSGITGLGLDAAVAHVHATRPPYVAFERWFVAHATHISPAEIVQHNHDMAVRVKPDAVAAEERTVLGIDDPTYNLSREINDLVDWHQLHAIALADR